MTFKLPVENMDKLTLDFMYNVQVENNDYYSWEYEIDNGKLYMVTRILF